MGFLFKKRNLLEKKKNVAKKFCWKFLLVTIFLLEDENCRKEKANVRSRGVIPGLVKRCPQVDGESSLRLVPAEVSSCEAN